MPKMKAKELREQARLAVEAERERNLEDFEFTELKKELKAEERSRRRIRYEKQAL
jgi:hypothetical protein